MLCAFVCICVEIFIRGDICLYVCVVVCFGEGQVCICVCVRVWVHLPYSESIKGRHVTRSTGTTYVCSQSER